MTADQEHRDHQQELQIALAECGLIEHAQEIKLNAYPSAFERRSEARRWHYQIAAHDKIICHVIVGQNLALVYQRTTEFFKACPELVCQPLHFFKKESGLGYLCLEHFSGSSLDTMVEQGTCDAEGWLKFARQAQATLEKTRRPSNRNALELEIATLMEEIKVFPGISELDLRLLRELAQPAIIEGALAESLTTRWSNGDFCGRNLLVDAQGGLRLIDYEFAAPTHFSSADWQRLLNYSTLPVALDKNSIPELQLAQEPWREIWFWLHHLAQLSNAEPSETLHQHLADAVSRLFAAIGQSAKARPTDGQTSMLINLLSKQENDTRVMLNERMAWVRTVEAEQISIKANFGRLTKEFAERTAWATAVDTELRTTQKDFVRVAQELAEQQHLVVELTKLKDACATLAPILNADAGTDERSLLHRCVLVLVDRQRDLAVTQAETRAAAGNALDSHLRAEVAETEINRLKAALTDAQVHVEHLLKRTTSLTLELRAMSAAKGAAANTCRLREQELTATLAELQALHLTVARYQKSWLCRIAKLISPSTPPTPANT